MAAVLITRGATRCLAARGLQGSSRGRSSHSCQASPTRAARAGYPMPADSWKHQAFCLISESHHTFHPLEGLFYIRKAVQGVCGFADGASHRACGVSQVHSAQTRHPSSSRAARALSVSTKKPGHDGPSAERGQEVCTEDTRLSWNHSHPPLTAGHLPRGCSGHQSRSAVRVHGSSPDPASVCSHCTPDAEPTCGAPLRA